MENLYLGNNQLSGPVPVDQLTGPIPVELGGLDSLS